MKKYQSHQMRSQVQSYGADNKRPCQVLIELMVVYHMLLPLPFLVMVNQLAMP